MLNIIAIITPGGVCVCLCVFVCKMNTILPWGKLAYQISCMSMQINPQANKSAQSPQATCRKAEGKAGGSRSRGRCCEGKKRIRSG